MLNSSGLPVGHALTAKLSFSCPLERGHFPQTRDFTIKELVSEKVWSWRFPNKRRTLLCLDKSGLTEYLSKRPFDR